MALGSGIPDPIRHTIKKQNENTHTNIMTKSLLAGKIDQDQSKHPEHTLSVAKPHRNISTSTAYVEDTNSMEVTYAQPRHTAQEPLYNANDLAPTLSALAAHGQGEAPEVPPSPTTFNPFSVAPSSLPTWHYGRTALNNPNKFYATMINYHPAADEPRPEPEARFAVRSYESTMEIEQGLSDLRCCLMDCQRRGDDLALGGLRKRISRAVVGLE